MRFKIFLAVVAMSVVQVQAAPNRYWAELARTQDGATLNGPDTSVKAVQFLLRARGSRIAADGVFGTQTESALKTFQRRHGLVASGKINGATWERLVPTLRPGARGDSVRAMQVLLGGFANSKVVVDGVFGSATQAALLKFQKESNIKADSIVGKETWSNLSPGQWEGC